ncbi:hypothetical protein L6452_10007 [Arctium lappa]|uniref:Uncharacterized protein n=1 Tax=Arctium lappa TaxID=4217 RepID=A0ACB9DLH9_ARCLA|nr:hypothetical protein L6452_10007 [Arctium lappa]
MVDSGYDDCPSVLLILLSVGSLLVCSYGFIDCLMCFKCSRLATGLLRVDDVTVFGNHDSCPVSVDFCKVDGLLSWTGSDPLRIVSNASEFGLDVEDYVIDPLKQNCLEKDKKNIGWSPQFRTVVASVLDVVLDVDPLVNGLVRIYGFVMEMTHGKGFVLEEKNDKGRTP